MTRHRASLATLLRAVQWELDTAAFEIGGGRYTTTRCHALAESLETVAHALREPRDDSPAPTPGAR